MSILAKIRTSTQRAHRAFEEHPLLERFMRDRQVDAYRGVLETFRAMVTLEMHHSDEFMADADRDILSYASWREALEKDLLAMESLHHLKVVPNVSLHVPALNTRSEFLGFLYALENIVVGGNEIADALPSSWPTAFLRKASHNKLRWPYFIRHLSDLENAGEILSDGVEKGAQKSFEAMVAMFDAFQFGNRGESPFYDHSSSP